MKNMKNEFKLGDKVKTLVNGKTWVKGEIIDICGDVAVVAIPICYGSTVEYIAVESKLEDLKDIITDIMYFKDKKGYMDLRLWD